MGSQIPGEQWRRNLAAARSIERWGESGSLTGSDEENFFPLRDHEKATRHNQCHGCGRPGNPIFDKPNRDQYVDPLTTRGTVADRVGCSETILEVLHATTAIDAPETLPELS